MGYLIFGPSFQPQSFEYWSPNRSVSIVSGIYLEGEDSHGDHGVGKLVEFRFKAPTETTSSSVTTHTPSGHSNNTSFSSQTQKAFTSQACP